MVPPHLCCIEQFTLGSNPLKSSSSAAAAYFFCVYDMVQDETFLVLFIQRHSRTHPYLGDPDLQEGCIERRSQRVKFKGIGFTFSKLMTN